MKKILVAGAALLMTASGYAVADNAFAAGDDETGLKITGDARFRFTFKDNYDFGGWTEPGERTTGKEYGHPKKRHDSRMRIRFKATTPGGAYAVGRVRVAEGWGENNDCDGAKCQSGTTWSDEAYIGVPFGDDFTLEVGKYRVSYGTGFYYDDLPMSGVRGIIKVGDWTINPFIEWESETESLGGDGIYGDDKYWDHDAIRYGMHVGGTVAEGWKVGGLLAYQSDSRTNYLWDEDLRNWTNKDHEGWMASVYVSGKSGPFGLKAEFAYNDGSLKGFNLNDPDSLSQKTQGPRAGGGWVKNGVDAAGNERWTFVDNRHIDYDDGFGGYIQPSFTIDALTLALNAGFAINGFTPDTNWGFIMLGSSQLAINAANINGFSDSTWWVGFIASYAISDDLKVTGIFAYADMTPHWWNKGSYIDDDGEFVRRHGHSASLEHAFELSASVDYAVTKSLAFKWAIGTLFASFDDPWQENTNPWGTLFQFNYKF